MRRRRKGPRTLLKIKAEDLCRFICRSRGRCENPHCKNGYVDPKNLQWAHIISRTYEQIKYDLDNCLCLCKGCHFYYTNHPIEWKVLINEMFGVGFYESLEFLGFSLIGGYMDYEALIIRLENIKSREDWFLKVKVNICQ